MLCVYVCGEKERGTLTEFIALPSQHKHNHPLGSTNTYSQFTRGLFIPQDKVT